MKGTIAVATAVSLLTGGRAVSGQSGPPGIVDPTPVLSIGEALGGPDAYAFTQVNGIVVVGDSLLVLDGVANEVRVFDRHGTFLGRIGRKGEGPGEFLWATSLRRVPEGLAVVDLRLRRQTLFSLSGDLLRTEPFGRLNSQPLAGSVAMRGGVTVAETAVTGSAAGSYPTREIVLLKPSTERIDTLAEYATGYVPFTAPGSFGFLTARTGSEGGWAVAGDSLVAVVADEPPTLRWWRATEDGLVMAGRLALPIESVAFTGNDQQDLIARERRARQESREPPLSNSARVEAPGYWGQVERVVLSDEQVCWIQWEKPREGGDQEWFRVDLRTRGIQQVRLPGGFRMLAAVGSNLYGYMLTDVDVPIVTVLRVSQGVGM